MKTAIQAYSKFMRVPSDDGSNKTNPMLNAATHEGKMFTTIFPIGIFTTVPMIHRLITMPVKRTTDRETYKHSKP